MGLAQYGRTYEKRQDPNGRSYYWALWSEPDQPAAAEADVTALRQGNVTLTPLDFNLTQQRIIGVDARLESEGLAAGWQVASEISHLAPPRRSPTRSQFLAVGFGLNEHRQESFEGWSIIELVWDPLRLSGIIGLQPDGAGWLLEASERYRHAAISPTDSGNRPRKARLTEFETIGFVRRSVVSDFVARALTDYSAPFPSAATSSVRSIPTGHQVMQRPHPVQPDTSN